MATVEALERKVVFITGASRGLGLALAEETIARGWRSVLVARSRQELDQIQSRYSADDMLSIAADVAHYHELERAVNAAIEAFGTIDVLVNNAAIDVAGPLATLPPEEWRRVIDVNLHGVFNATHLVYQHMRNRKSGCIMTVSSVLGRRGVENAIAYCSSKAALNGFNQALLAEARQHNIRCTLVVPGGIDTGWHKQRHPEFMQPLEMAKLLLDVADNKQLYVPELLLTPRDEQMYP